LVGFRVVVLMVFFDLMVGGGKGAVLSF